MADHPRSASTESARARPGPSVDRLQESLRVDRRLIISGFLFGCGIAGSVIDLFIFHLVLQWHHFYDLSTTRVALLSDGIFHAVTWVITVWSLFMLADVRRQIRVPWGRWAAAVTTGVGVFQLFDGVVNHKILGIHQIRYGVDLLLYDLVWLGSAILLVIIGLIWLWVTRSDRLAAAGPRGDSRET